MVNEEARLLAVAEAVASGHDVDWTSAEREISSEEGKRRIQELRSIAEIFAVSQTGPAAVATTSASTETAPTSQVWGFLEIRKLIASGAFGSVYRAWDPTLRREVALKLLRPQRSSRVEAVREGRLLARVQHPNVVRVYGADEIAGRLGVWMEFIEGRTLEDALRRDGPIGANEAALIGRDLCGALAAVHAAGLVHRDVKTRNVMREDGGRIVLMDFGAGEDFVGPQLVTAVGTPAYMAPEVLEGGRATPRSDIYALGVLLFRLVSAGYPVAGRSATEVGAAHAQGERQRLRDLRPGLPGDFVRLVERALASDPDARFATAGEMEGALDQVLRAAPEPPGPGRRRWRRIGFATAAVVATTATIVELSPAMRAHARAWLWAPRTLVVAVLPFRDLSTGGEQPALAAGVTEILVSRLSTIRALRVVSGPTVPASAVDASRPARLIAASHAEHVVDGSVQRDQNRLRVTARVVEAATGSVEWSQTYERPIEDLFTLQGEIAATIAQHVRAALSPHERQQLADRHSTSADAQDAYFRGRYLLYQFNPVSAGEARQLLERAVALDPSYALAHASLARLYLLLGEYRILTPDAAGLLAVSEAQRAVENGVDLPEAHVALAEVRFKVLHDMAAAEVEYGAAHDLAPLASIVTSPYSRFLSATGRPDIGLDQALEGFRADPISPEMAATVAITAYYVRRYDEAEQWFERAIALDNGFAPGFFGRARARAARGAFADAVQDCKHAIGLAGEDDVAYTAELGRIYAAGGWRNSAEQILGALLQKGPAGYVAPEDLAYIYAALGDRDRAMTLLEDAVRQHGTRLLFLRVDPRVDSLRDDPRFAELMRALGL